MKQIFSFISIWLINILVAILNLVIRRDKHIWLFGSWMGEKFSDNPRFLFQYLHENLNPYSIKKVVWVSDREEIVEELCKQGYEAYLKKSWKGKYYHLKSGVHIICNASASRDKKNDIDTRLSFGATKIQLWHGVGIKAVGYLKNTIDDNSIKQILIDKFITPYGKPGMWGKCFHLATSQENKRVAILDFHVSPNRIIMANYPRLCPCIRLMPEEVNVIETIKNARIKGKKIILFLPTFRESSSYYTYPRDIEGFTDFIQEENILWIQKRHSADRNLVLDCLEADAINLEPSFDINVLYDYIDLLITDYSSASSDAIFKEIPTLEYCPDFDYYKSTDRGFVNDFDKYHIGHLVKSPETLAKEIACCLLKNDDDYKRAKNVKHFLFDDHNDDYDLIVKSIIDETGIKII